jgi:stage V sporulation protein S
LSTLSAEKAYFILFSAREKQEFFGRRRIELTSPMVDLTKGGREVEVLKVSAQSNPKSVAGALAAVLREHGAAEVQAVGAGAVNQAVKAVAIARGFVAPNGMDLVCVPAFAEIEIDGEERTAIKLLIGPR